MERPQCCIDKCLTKTKSIKVKDIIYYLFPTDADWANKWEKKIKDFDPKYRRKSNDIVCSLHFAKSSMQPITRQLVDHALPVYFPQKVNESHVEQNPDQLVAQKSVKSISNSTPMLSKCCIVGCPTDFSNAENKINGFKFPESSVQRNKWINMIELYNNQKIDWKDSMNICALHFSSTWFTKDDQLDESAKPTIFKDATLRRHIEIAKQQSQQTQSNNQHRTQSVILQRTQANNTQPKQKFVTKQTTQMVAHSINVPLHKKKMDNQKNSIRSAPIIGRRLSLPYAKLPPLIPKPNILKRVNPTELRNLQLANKMQRLSVTNIVVSPVPTTSTVTATIKANLRPVPALNKMISVASSTNTVQSIVKKALPVNLSSSTANVSSGKLIPVKAIQISRLPPTLKPRPQQQTTTASSTNSKLNRIGYIDTQMPIITKIHCAKSNKNANINSDTVNKQTNAISNKPDLANQEENLDIIVIEDDEVEMALALDQSKSTEAGTANNTETNTNGAPQYVGEDMARFKYPRLLLERILMNKRKNRELEIKSTQLRKQAARMNQQYRLSTATTSSETIEIS